MEIIKRFLRRQGKRAGKADFNEAVRAAQGGSLEARNWCVEQNLGLVFKAAGRYNHNCEDAFQEGTIGLMRAIETYEPERGLHFSTYATPWIKSFIARSYENTRTTIRFPVHLQHLNKKFNKLKSDNPGKEDEFIVELIAAQKKVSPQTVLWCIKLNERTLFSHIDDPENKDILRTIVDPNETDCNTVDFRKLMEVLTYREKFILMQRAEGFTLSDCAGQLDISRERVRQVEVMALKKLRATINLKDKAYLFK